MRTQKRLFPKRISQEDLNEQTTQVLQQCGVENHTQSLFYTYLSSAVNSTHPNQFVPLKCHIKDKTREAWSIAFQIVGEFLETNQMSLTIQTMNTEDKMPLQYKSNVVSRLRLSTGYPIIGELLRATSSYRRLSLKQKLMINSTDNTHFGRKRKY